MDWQSCGAGCVSGVSGGRFWDVAVFVGFWPFVGSRSAVLQGLDLSFTCVVCVVIDDHVEGSSCPNVSVCGFRSRVAAEAARRRPVWSARWWLWRLQFSSWTRRALCGVARGG